MTAKTELSAPKRRSRAEVQQLVAEFVSSGMRRSEFCQSRGLSFSTLDRHLRKLRWKRRRKPISSAARLVAVRPTRRKRGVRLPSRPWTRWTEAVLGTVRRHSANGRLHGLRSDRRDENGICRFLVSCKKTVFLGSAAHSTRPGCNSACGTDGRAFFRRRRSSPHVIQVRLKPTTTVLRLNGRHPA